VEAPCVDPHLRQELLEQHETAQRPVIPVAIMAIAGMTAQHHHAVRAFAERGHHELRVHPATAHDADKLDAGGIRQFLAARLVRAGVRTPVTDECDDRRITLSH
jgi:hypothetical protein